MITILKEWYSKEGTLRALVMDGILHVLGRCHIDFATPTQSTQELEYFQGTTIFRSPHE